MNEIAEWITKHLSSFVEILAAIVIGLALLQFLYRYAISIFKPNVGTINQNLRIKFGSFLTVALVLLLGADILATAIGPIHGDEIGKLAAIAALRTTNTASTAISKEAPKRNIPKGVVDFVAASKAVMPTVVNIKIHFNSSAADEASGSGVIISGTGYIATNNHVLENASKIDVTLADKRTLSAKLIGRDLNTDLFKLFF